MTKATFSRYGSWGMFRLCRDILVTRLFWRSARLVRQPIYVRGRRKIYIGNGLTTGVGVRLDAFGDNDGVQLTIGDRVQLNDYVHIAAIHSIKIGNDVLIASRVFISDHNHGTYDDSGLASAPDQAPAIRPLSSSAVEIGDNTWIGESVCILPGVKIGRGSVVGAGSVVTRSVPDARIVVGNPARPIKRYDAERQRWLRL